MKVRLRHATRGSCSYVPWDHAEIVRRFTAFCPRLALQTLSLRLVIRTCGQLCRNDIRNVLESFRLAGVLVAIKHFNAEVLWSIAQAHSSSVYHATRLLARHRRRYGHLRSHRSRGYPSDYRHTVCGCPRTGATPSAHTSRSVGATQCSPTELIWDGGAGESMYTQSLPAFITNSRNLQHRSLW